MSNLMKEWIVKFKDYNYRVLWAESMVLAFILGAWLNSLLGIIILISAFMYILRRRGGTVYMIVVLSCLWGILAGYIGFKIFGWAWAVMLGGLALISGVKIHCRDLRRPFVSEAFEQFNENKWRQNWHLGHRNLN